MNLPILFVSIYILVDIVYVSLSKGFYGNVSSPYIRQRIPCFHGNPRAWRARCLRINGCGLAILCSDCCLPLSKNNKKQYYPPMDGRIFLWEPCMVSSFTEFSTDLFMSCSKTMTSPWLFVICCGESPGAPSLPQYTPTLPHPIAQSEVA